MNSTEKLEKATAIGFKNEVSSSQKIVSNEEKAKSPNMLNKKPMRLSQ